MKFGLREIVFVVLLMGIPVGAWWFVYRPSGASVVQMRKQIEAKQAKLRELNQATATIGDLRKQITSLEEAVAYFQSKLPSEKKIDSVLREIWLLAEGNDLVTKNIKTLERNNSGGSALAGAEHAEQPIALQFEGEFLGYYAFLLALENQPRITRIHSMTLKTIDAEP